MKKHQPALAIFISLIAIGTVAPPVRADTSPEDQATIAQLVQAVTNLQKTVVSDRAEIAELNAQLSAQQTTTEPLTQSGEITPDGASSTTYGPFTVVGNNVYLTGYNLYIQSGSGSTTGTVNGLGNLILGYNETRGVGKDTRTGSHNLILGTENNFSSYSSMVGGIENDAYGPEASILGGYKNTTTGRSSVILCGDGNTAGAHYTAIVGGENNTASGDYAVVGGGSGLKATVTDSFLPLDTDVSTIDTTLAGITPVTHLFSLSNGTGAGTELTLSGVNLHIVNGTGSTRNDNGLGNLIVGYNETRASEGGSGDLRTGSHNIITGLYNNYDGDGGIIGGFQNYLGGSESFVVGENNAVKGDQSTVTGGQNNSGDGNYITIAGGYTNTIGNGPDEFLASISHCVIVGGESNAITEDGFESNIESSVIGAGNGNSISMGPDTDADSVADSVIAGGNGNSLSNDGFLTSLLGCSIVGGEDNSISFDSSVAYITQNGSVIGGGSGLSTGTNDGWSAGSQGSTTYSGMFTSP